MIAIIAILATFSVLIFCLIVFSTFNSVNCSSKRYGNKVEPKNILSRFSLDYAHKQSLTDPVFTSKEARNLALSRLKNIGVKSVILWGHPLGSHTHSYIHNAFVKAFKDLKFNVDWFDGKKTESIPNGALVITEGEAAKSLPVNPKAFYVLHNVSGKRFKKLPKSKKVILQVVTNCIHVAKGIPIDGNPVQRLDSENNIFMAWASDMLPEEIALKVEVPFSRRKNEVVFVGTVDNGTSTFQNGSELKPFIDECVKLGMQDSITGKKIHGLTFEQNVKRIGAAAIAPAIVGKWQREHGYVPCRLFKNITYGAIPITNSELCKEILPESIFAKTPELLAQAAVSMSKDYNLAEKVWLKAVNRVKNHHTYINRIAALAFAFEQKQLNAR